MRDGAVSALGEKSRPQNGSAGSGVFDPAAIGFALLYGSGFVGIKFSLPYCDPLRFLAMRFALASGLIACIAWARRAPFPRGRELLHIAIAGMLTSGVFSIGAFMAIYLGLAPAMSALIVSMQPIVVGIGAGLFFRERLSTSGWAGLLIGILGVTLVLWNRMDSTGVNQATISLALLGLSGVSVGNLYQKRYCSQMNIFSGGAVQNLTACVFTLGVSLLWGRHYLEWTPQLIGSLLYMAVGVSVGALSLLFLMIKNDRVTKVASVYYLVPVFAALFGYLLFDQSIDLPMLGGMALVAFGVWVVRHFNR